MQGYDQAPLYYSQIGGEGVCVFFIGHQTKFFEDIIQHFCRQSMIKKHLLLFSTCINGILVPRKVVAHISPRMQCTGQLLPEQAMNHDTYQEFIRKIIYLRTTRKINCRDGQYLQKVNNDVSMCTSLTLSFTRECSVTLNTGSNGFDSQTKH